MKNLTILCVIFLFFNLNVMKATQYNWKGPTDNYWNEPTNWDPNGVPSTNDTVIIHNSTHNPILRSNVTVKKLTMSSGTLNLDVYTLTISKTAKLNSGGINKGTSGNLVLNGDTCNFLGTIINTPVTAIANSILISGTEFKYTTYLELTGNSVCYSAGGNTFDAKTTIKNSGSGLFVLADLGTNTFADSVNFIATAGEGIELSVRGKTYFNAPVTISCTSGNILFGDDASDSTFLSAGNKISIGTAGFSSGTFLLRKFIQLGTTSLNLSFTSSAVLNILSSTFNAPMNIISPTILLNNVTFNDSISILKNGSSSSLSYGGNTFNGYSKFENQNDGEFRLANTIGDSYNNDVKFISSTNGIMRFAYNGLNYFQKNIELTPDLKYISSGNGIVVFVGDSNQTFLGNTFTFNKIKVDKSAGNIQFDSTITVSDSLIFIRGNIITSDAHVLTLKSSCKVIGASNKSFVDGPVKKIGNTAFVFPVGNINFYRPLEITAPSTSTDAFTAQYFHQGQQFGDRQDTTLGQLSGCNYWSINRNNGSSNVSIALSWDSIGCTIYDTATIKIAYWNSGNWKDLGKSNLSGDYYKGKTWNNTSLIGFGYFTLAYYNPVIAPITPIFYADLGDATKNHDLAIDYYGYNGGRNTILSWSDIESLTILKNKNISSIRIPFGTGANYWDWREGWYIPEKELPNNWIYLTPPFTATKQAGNLMDNYKLNADFIAASTIFNLNLLTSDFHYQLASLYNANRLNLPVKYVEFGNEFYLNQEHYIQSFPDPKSYMDVANNWCSELKSISPFASTEVALIGAISRDGSSGRQKLWLDGILNNINSPQFDAITLHQYITAGVGLANNANPMQMLTKPFIEGDNFILDEVKKIRDFDNSPHDPLNIWMTEYNLDDDDCKCVGTWPHALFVAAMTLKYLEASSITKAISHTFISDPIFGNIFDSATGFDKIPNPQRPNSYPPATNVGEFTAMGTALNEIAIAGKNADYVRKIDFGTITSVPSAPSNPIFYGWVFENTNNNNKEIIVLNLTNNPRDIILSNLIPSNIYNVKEIYKNLSDLLEGIEGNPVPTAGTFQLTEESIINPGSTFTTKPYSLTRISEIVLDKPVIKLSDNYICKGSDGSIVISGGTPPYTINANGSIYNYSAITTLTDPNVLKFSTLNPDPDTYTISVTDNNSVSATVTPTLTVYPGIIPFSITGTTSPIDICKGAIPINLSAVFIPGTGGSNTDSYSYLWTPSTGIVSACSTNTFTPPFGPCISVSPEESTTYQVYVTDGHCWSRSDNEIKINVKASKVSAGDDITVCSGSAFTLSADYVHLPTAHPSYAWSAGATTANINETKITSASTGYTTYTVTLTDGGCPSTYDDVKVFGTPCCVTSGAYVISPVNNSPIRTDYYFLNNQDPTKFLMTLVPHVNDPTINDLYIDPAVVNVSLMQINGELDFANHNGSAQVNRYEKIIFRNCKIQLGENAILRLSAGSFVRFENCKLTSCSGKMWQGIIVDKKGANADPTISIDGSTISDAIQAVYITRPADYRIENSTFDNNYVDIAFEKYYQRAHYDSEDFSYKDKFIRNCTFTSNGSTLIAPYSSVHKLAAIELNDVENIDVGDIVTGSTSTNTIEKSNFGIFSTSSGFRCYNTIFDEIHNYELSGGNPSGTAIYTGEFNSFSDHTFTIGQDITDGGNIFKNALNGISIYGPANSEIHNNIFGAYVGTTANPITGVGIYTSFTGDKSIRISDNNEFFDYAVGIHVSEITSNSNLHIMNNQFYNGNGGTTNFDGTAIAVENYFNSAVPFSAEISHNEIGDNATRQGRIGIYASQIDNLLIEQNNIFYHQTAAPTTHFNGIWVVNANESNIIQNSISNDSYHAGAKEFFTGIELDNCTYPVITCNSLSNLGYSMQFINQSMQAKIITNSMIGYDHAIYLNNGLIGAQGDVNYGWSNNWNVLSSLNRAAGSTSSGLASDWYYDMSNGIGQTNPKSIDPSSGVVRGQSTYAEYYDGCDGLIIIYPRNAILGGIIADSAKYEETYEAYNRYYASNATYITLKKHPEYLTLDAETDASFQNWYDSVATTSIEKLDLILNYYNSGKYLQARDSNNALTSYYAQEALLDTVLKINLKHKINLVNYSHADSTKLASIAEENPLFKGVNAVISARNTLFREIHDGALTYPERKAKYESEKDDFIQITIFPNPAYLKLNYLSPNDLSGYKIIIKDMLGKTIKQDIYNGSTNILNLEAGIYSIEFLKEGIIKYKSKFVKQ